MRHSHMDVVFACWNFLLFKAEKQSKKFQRRNAAAANESTLRMWLN